MRVCDFQEKHLNSVIELSNLSFGKNYLNASSLLKYITNNEKLCFVVLKDNIVIGYTLIDILSPIALKNKVLKAKNWFYDEVKHHQKVVLIKQLVVLRKQ